jgi:hypothetical protein
LGIIRQINIREDKKENELKKVERSSCKRSRRSARNDLWFIHVV